MTYSLDYLQTYLPSTRITVSESAQEIRRLGKQFTESDERKLQEMGFVTVPVERERRLEEMIEQACAPVLERVRREGKPVDRILLVRTLQVQWHERNLFRKLLHDFDMTETPVIGIGQQNCASIHMAMHLVQSQFAHLPHIKGILLVAADKAFHPELRRIPDSVLGDGAACCYLSRTADPHRLSHRILNVQNIVDGTTYEGINSKPEDIEWFNTTYYFATRQVVNRVLRQAGLRMDDIQLVVGSNANRNTWVRLAEVLGCSLDKFYLKGISEVGHLYCADILYNIKQAVADGSLRPGDTYLTVTVGLGGTYGCALHRYEDHREEMR